MRFACQVSFFLLLPLLLVCQRGHSFQVLFTYSHSMECCHSPEQHCFAHHQNPHHDCWQRSNCQRMGLSHRLNGSQIPSQDFPLVHLQTSSFFAFLSLIVWLFFPIHVFLFLFVQSYGNSAPRTHVGSDDILLVGRLFSTQTSFHTVVLCVRLDHDVLNLAFGLGVVTKFHSNVSWETS